MTKKAALQKELLEKVKPGTKPSHLKRSKSLSDIPQAPPLPKLDEMEQLKKENEQLKQEAQATAQRLNTPSADQVAEIRELLHDLAKSGNTSFTDPNQALNTLTEELKKQTDLNVLLSEQLKEKQQEIEELRKQLEVKHTPTELSELDQSLISRHKSLKDWFIQYQKNQVLEKELSENIDEAATELINQDQTISQLRSQISQLKLTNQSLTKDLDLTTKLAQMRKSPLPENNSNHSNLLVYAFLALWFIALLNSSWNHNFKENE